MTKGKTGQKTWLPCVACNNKTKRRIFDIPFCAKHRNKTLMQLFNEKNMKTIMERRKEVSSEEMADIAPLNECELNAISLYRLIIRDIQY